MISLWPDQRRRRWRLRKAVGVHASDVAAAAVADESSHALPPIALSPWEQFARDCAVSPRARVLVTSRAGLRLSVPLTDPVLFIGSGAECRLRFVDAGLDRRHYALFWLAGSLYGIDLHRAQRQPDRSVGRWWSEDTTVELGRFRLRAQHIAPPPFGTENDRAAALPLQLQWVAGERTHTERVRARLTLLGTGSSCSLRLHDPRLAPVQAALVRTPRSLALIDLAENTWTRRVGEPIAASLLDPGDEFEIGRTVFQVISIWDEARAFLGSDALACAAGSQHFVVASPPGVRSDAASGLTAAAWGTGACGSSSRTNGLS